MENTTQSPSDGDQAVPVVGLNSYLFNLIHVTALLTMSVSILASFGVFYYLLRPCRKSFFARPANDRTIIYLALCDCLVSVFHSMDHAIVVATKKNPPTVPCVIFGFALNFFTMGQSLLTVYVAVNAFIQVVFNKKMPRGRYDWVIFLIAGGVPLFLSVLIAATGHFGPNGIWCLYDIRKPLAPVFNNTLAIVTIICFVFLIICYSGIWAKIRQSARVRGGTGKYDRTVRVMMLFVLAYIVQWWAFVTFAFWGLFSMPHFIIMWAAVCFSNLGGLFNFLAYTYVRKRQKANAVEDSSTATGTTGTN